MQFLWMEVSRGMVSFMSMEMGRVVSKEMKEEGGELGVQNSE